MLLGLALGLLLSAGGYGQDIVANSRTEGYNELRMGPVFQTVKMDAPVIEEYYDSTTAEDELRGIMRYHVSKRGTARISSDSGQTWGPIYVNVLLATFQGKVNNTGADEPILMTSGDEAVFHRTITGPGAWGSIDDTLYVNGDMFEHHITGSERLPEGGFELNLTSPALYMVTTSHYLEDGAVRSRTDIWGNTLNRGEVQITVESEGTFTCANPRIALPATIESSFSMTSFVPDSGYFEMEGTVVAGPYRGEQVPSLNRWGLAGLLGVMVLSAAVVLVRRRRAAS